jgi:hypothetical protein
VAAGAAVVAGGISGKEIAMMVIEEAFDLKGLDTARLRNFDLGEVLNTFRTPCFTAGTLISTEQGLRAIESLKAGDQVWALGQGTVEVELKPITEVFRSEVTNLVILTIGNERIETTAEHPFWVRDEGWVEAGQLKAGDHLLARGHTWLPITSVESRSGQFTVFNFEVEGWHTYLVGSQDVVVHNRRLNASGFWNYRLVDASGKTYYHGMAGPNSTIKDVARRHSNNSGRFNPQGGDQLVPERGTRTYAQARRMEHERILKDKTLLNDPRGKNAKNYRGNRQHGISGRNLKKYYPACNR